jgi:enoyl-CoA hydratase/carnithine racemase
MLDDDVVGYAVEDHVAILTWNRPEQNNAWSPALEVGYFARLREAAADPRVRVIVVRGAGRHLCPGTDMAALASAAAGNHDNDPELREPQTLPMTIPKPVVLAIHGACAGTGFIQATVADVRFVERDARITPAFARRGIMVEHGLSVLLPRLIGMSRATDVLLSARVLSGREAFEIGLATHLSESGSAFSDALAYAKEMARSCSPIALAVSKRQLWEEVQPQLEAARLEAMRLWRDIREHPDFTEGVQSFRDRRPPSFEPLTTASFDQFATGRRDSLLSSDNDQTTPVMSADVDGRLS